MRSPIQIHYKHIHTQNLPANQSHPLQLHGRVGKLLHYDDLPVQPYGVLSC